jgi:hypothetical protein
MSDPLQGSMRGGKGISDLKVRRQPFDPFDFAQGKLAQSRHAQGLAGDRSQDSGERKEHWKDGMVEYWESQRAGLRILE